MDRGRRVSRSRSRSRDRSRSRGRDRSRDRPANARLADKRVYISNIPYDSRWQDIKDLFRKEVGEVAFVELFNDESDKPRGCGIIEFENNGSAKKAIEKMHRFELGGRKIVVKEDYDVERDKFGRIVTGPNKGNNPGRGDRDRSREQDRDNRGGGGGDWDRRIDDTPPPIVNLVGKYGNTYGLSSQFLESLGIDGSLIPRIFISNLDFRVDDKKLKEVFRLAGRVLSVEVNKDKDGKSRGHATIEYEHPVEAVQAISMFNNQQLYERRMHVKMDRLSDPLADLAKNRLPDGLRSIGMGLGVNGQPLVDVARNLPGNSSGGSGTTATVISNVGTALGNAGLGNPLALNALNLSSLGVNQLASVLNPQQLGDLNVGLQNAQAQAANVFNLPANVGQQVSALNAAQNQYGNPGNLQMSAMGVGNPGNVGGLQSAVGSLMGSGGGGSNVGGGVGSGNPQQSPFQNSGNGNQGGPQNANFRDMDYGYSTQVFNNPSGGYGNNSFQNDKPQFGNGVNSGGGGGGGGGVRNSNASNTVVVANLPPSCTWQTLKSKFRDCGEVVYAEKRDNNTGIVRFSNDRDAERARFLTSPELMEDLWKYGSYKLYQRPKCLQEGFQSRA